MSFSYWTFEERPPKKPETLADAVEHVDCLCWRAGELVVRRRAGTNLFSRMETGEYKNTGFDCSVYKFERYLDDPIQIRKPMMMLEAEVNRLYEFNESISEPCFVWIDANAFIWRKRGSEIAGTDYGNLGPVFSTNIYAKLVTIGPAQ